MTAVSKHYTDYDSNNPVTADWLNWLNDNVNNYAVAAGTGNAVVLQFNPALTSVPDGFRIGWKGTAANSGATTLQVFGYPAYDLLGAGSPLTGGELLVGGFYGAQWDNTNQKWRLCYQSDGAVPTAPGIGANQAINAGQLGTVISTDNLRNQVVTSFQTAGAAPAYTATPVPTLTSRPANLRLQLTFHSPTPSGPSTLTVGSTATAALKQYDSAGNKFNAVVAAGQMADIEFDGTDYVILNPLPGSTPFSAIQTQIQAQTATFFTTSGTSPTFALTPNPAMSTLQAGFRFNVKFHAAVATGASTINISSSGAIGIKQYGADGALIDAVIQANQIADLQYNGTNWVILNPTIIQKRQQVFTASGSFTIPNGVTTVYLSGSGGGGGGGASNSTVNGGGGGASGACAVETPVTVVPGTVTTVTIGAGGSGGAGTASANGTSGSATAFGALLTLAGGPFGVGGGAGGSPAGVGGAGGGVGIASAYGAFGGAGAGNVFAPPVTNSGAAGVRYGGGGAGGSPTSGGGGSGAAGILIIRW